MLGAGASPNAIYFFKPRSGDKIIARGERSEPLVGICIIRSPEWAKELDKYIFRPFRALS
jgi:hypothetical protein